MNKLIVFIFIVISGNVMAQVKYFYVNLDVNQPVSNTNWIKDASARGIKAGYRAFINSRFSAGLDVTSSTLDQYQPRETIQNPTGALTTDYFKYLYTYSAVASGQYTFKVGEGRKFFPYAGLGLGALHTEYVLYYNIYKDSEASWGFLARPEAGILVRFGERRSIGAMAAVHYDYATNKSEKFNYSNYSTVGFQIGVMFMEF
jgi:hypothetical protein